MIEEHFITPEKYETLKSSKLISPNGWLLFVACNSGIELAKSVKNEYERMLESQESSISEIPLIGTRENPLTSIFSDSETCPRLPTNVAGSDAYVFQSVQENISHNSVNENIQQLLQVVRTLRAHRAKSITVITPYCPYSRQDKPTFMKRESVLAGLFADQLKIAGANIFLTYHPHTMALCGLYEPEIQLVALSGLDLFINIFKHFKNKKRVAAVSTDAGGTKFTIHFSTALNISHAIANKFRNKTDNSNLLGITGDLEGKDTAIIIDDETVTGGSVLNTVKGLYKNHGIKETYVAISHMKLKKEFIPQFIEANKKYGLKELHITDTIPQIPELLNQSFIKLHHIDSFFSSTINRLHYNQSISKVFTGK